LINNENYRKLRDDIRNSLDLSNSMSDTDLRIFIEDAVFNYSLNNVLSSVEKIDLVKRIFNSLRGYDVLQPLIDDKSITEIMVNSVDQIFIEKNGDITQVPKIRKSWRILSNLLLQRLIE